MRRREQPLRPPSVSNPLRQISQIVIYAANWFFVPRGAVDVVRAAGLEPAWAYRPREFKSHASTISPRPRARPASGITGLG